MECPPTRAEAWLEEHEGDLAGLPTADAIALIESAGLRVRVLDRGARLLSPETWDDRVNLRVTDDAVVGAVSAG
ncbi:hypothetical protein [Amnibacterium setariae]|uniref:Uncharacterized protein n=1 Tax=Amnibacterium setariae TaxID=2306585 RepID=A0A3A1TX96_9MICO|nr:hypothetical protein [Amnibacterium setariae]RIX28400.1 hypothetical protein D1781_13275 [Amnibacterium setariae]